MQFHRLDYLHFWFCKVYLNFLYQVMFTVIEETPPQYGLTQNASLVKSMDVQFTDIVPFRTVLSPLGLYAFLVLQYSSEFSLQIVITAFGKTRHSAPHRIHL